MKIEKYICDDGKYRYIYKITIIPTNQYYYGQHTQKCDEADFYMGSGSKLNKIYELSGFTIANKEICCYAESENELNELEKFYIGDKYKDDPLCLNMIPGGNYKRSDELKHEVAVLGGKAFAEKLKNDVEFAKEYSEKQSKKGIEFRADKQRYDKMNEVKSQKLKDFFKVNGPTGFCLDNKRKGKIQITNDLTLQTMFIDKNDPLPNGWRYGKPRKNNAKIIYDYNPHSGSYFKCFSKSDSSIIYVRNDCQVPDGYIKATEGMKGKCRIINKVTKEIRCIPIECNFTDDWEYAKHHKEF